MATNRHGGGASLLLWAAVALTVVATAQAQQGLFPGFPNYVFGQCPGYQSSPGFSQEYIDQLTTSTADGYVLVLSDGSADTCQKLKFLDEETFKYSYSDIANRPRVYSSTYTATPANLTHPAQIKLNMVTGMLGADLIGRLTLLPLVADADKMVLSSCQELGALKTEQLLVFVPYPSTANVTAIKDELVLANIPNAGRLAEISQECTPGSRRTPQPLPLRFYNLLSALNNPARQVQNAAGSIRASESSRHSVNQPSFRSGAVVDDAGNVFAQPADNAIPFYSGNFEVPVFHNYQQPFISSFSSGYPAAVTYSGQQAPFVPYTAPQTVAASTNYHGGFPNSFYTQFYSQAR